ncbi:MAG: DUF1844 domain-containing protein [Armatimonadota bacterium]|nr:MAG: DUF1844 domain-containing protein [Armatimonadota bacterium]
MTSDEDAKTQNSQTPGPEGEDPSPPAEPEPKPEQADAQAAEAPEPPAEEQPEAPQEPPQPLDVYAVLRISIAQLAGVAWQLMGLQPDPFTNKLRKDVDQARIAIDATAALVEQLQPNLRGQEARDYQTLLTDLRLNFVKQSGEEAKQE